MTANEILALLGGQPVRGTPLPAYNTIGAEEKAAVMEVLDSGELSGFVASPGEDFYGGRWVRGLEQDFCEFFGSRHAVSVNSATSGLHCAIAATGVGPGDEVIVPPYTMSASATTVLFTGAVPIFADIDDLTFCLDPAAVEANITPQTRAIVAVNLFGQAAPLDELRKIADTHGLYLIEDNAQAPAAMYRSRYAGTVGHAGVFSFNRHKTMQSGEGGVIITDDPKLAEKAALMRNHGEVVVKDMGVTDLVNAVGLNYRMSEMEAAVARVQFAKLEALNAARVQLADRLTAGLADIEGLSAPHIPEGNTHVYYFYPIRFDTEAVGLPRDLFCRAVEAEGYILRAGYVKPIYLEPMYQQKICFGENGFPFSANPRNDTLDYRRGLCPVVERLADAELMVTSITYPPLAEEDMDGFVEACCKVIRNRDKLLNAGLTTR